MPMRTVCGLDVHKDSVFVCILNENGILFQEKFGWHTEDVILHSHEIRRCKNYFKVLQDLAVKQEFYSELDRIL